MNGFWRSWQAKRCLFMIALGLGLGLLSLVPYFSLLEEKIGLGLQFTVRGERLPPTEVAIVDIDRESAQLLSVSGNPEQWPRRLHADLIRRLNAAGAELIGFNIFFSTPQPEDDEAMATAMRESGSVVLASYLTLQHLQGDAYVERLEEPPAVLASSALAIDPFLLAQGEESDRFLIRYGEGGDRPTFPLMLLRLFTFSELRGELGGLIPEGESSLQGASVPSNHRSSYLSRLESAFEQQPQLFEAVLRRLQHETLPAVKHYAILSLLETISGDKAFYFNHYGAEGTISRIPYHMLVQPQNGSALPDLHGKVILVGFDEDFQSDKSENIFFSPYSQVSSLELVATAVANLLNHTIVRPIFERWGLFCGLILWGGLLGWLSSKRLRIGLPCILLLAVAYYVTAYGLFKELSLWLPLILPLFCAIPVAMVACLVGNYVMSSKENKAIHSVINRFIPDEATKREHPEDDEQWVSKVSFGVCLATDAGQYTSLAEKMNPMDLGELMNEYYSSLFPVVRRNGGWVSDVTGDAMMAIWTIPTSQTDIRIGALRAALEVLSTVDIFQQKYQVRLPIRMGLHCGEMRVGFVGGKENAAYRAVGDTVNTSARLEGLNKVVGTRILVSKPLVDGVEGFVIRPVGSFMLAGKTHPVDAYELIATLEETEPRVVEMVAQFIEALGLFKAAQWQDAADAFLALLSEFPDDGPAQFYARTACVNAGNPLATPDMASIQVGKSPPGALANH